MRAAILAAGLGSRLRPFTDHTPKPLLTVGNVPLIDHALALVRRAGISRIGVNLHKHAGMLREHLQELDTEIVLSEEPVLLGTGGGLRQIEERLGGDGPLLVVNADALCGDVDLSELIAIHERQQAMATLLLRTASEGFTPIWRDGEGRVRHIGDRGDAPADWERRVFTGIHVLEPRLLRALPAGQPCCLIAKAYRPALSRGEHFASLTWPGYWSDVGAPERLLEANLAALETEVRLPGGLRGERSGATESLRLVDSTAILDASARLHGTIVGPDVRIGSNAIVSRSVLLKGARVEPEERLDGRIRGADAEWAFSRTGKDQESR
ncbi:MAG: sugar phosphate nucleotidyltransferase [Planctomycetota bacterium]